MKRKTRLIALVALLMAAVLVLSSCAADAAVTGKKKKNTTPTPAVTAVPEATEEPGPIIEPQRIADYLFEHGELPENFITKKEAERLGWKTTYRYVSDLGPGITIGGDYFGNYEQKLPAVKGRKYAEADCYYQGGPRNEYRIIYSNDGHVWYTGDHYNTFIELYPTDQ